MNKSITALFVTIFTILSCEEVISVEDISSDKIEIIAPSEGAVVPNGQLNLNWDPVAFANNYQVQVAEPDFQEANQVLLDTVTVDTIQNGRHQISLSLGHGSYEWRVRAINSAYSTSYSVASFKVDTTVISSNAQTKHIERMNSSTSSMQSNK